MKNEIEFPVVGSQYILGGIELSKSLEIGDQLTLIREPDNEYDKSAVAVFFSGKKLGYVPNRGTSCKQCWSHIGKEHYVCPNCGGVDFVKGGLATRLIGSKFIDLPYTCTVYDVNPESENVVIKVLMIIE